MAFRIQRSKGSWKGFCIIAGLVMLVLASGFFLGQKAVQIEIDRVEASTSGLGAMLASALQEHQIRNITIEQAQNSVKPNELDVLAKQWVSTNPILGEVAIVRHQPDGSALILAGEKRNGDSTRKLAPGSHFRAFPEQVSKAFEGKQQFYVENSDSGRPAWINIIRPVHFQGKVDSVLILRLPAEQFLQHAASAQSAIYAMMGIMIILLVGGGLALSELVESMAVLRVSKAELLLQGERIRDQMDMIAEKNQAMAAHQSKLAEMNAKLQALATMDGLTGVMNHKTLMEFLGGQMKHNSGIGAPCSVILIDIDNFKQLNDEYGHLAGDEALRALGVVLRQSCPPGSGVGRYGGEEFMMILPGASETAATVVAEELRRRIQLTKTTSRPVTASIGVSTVYSMAKSEQALIDEADRALYFSKRNGKNRVTHFGHGLINKTA